MRVVLLTNAASGRGRKGRGAEVVACVARGLQRAGHDVVRLDVAEVREHQESLSNALRHADVLVIAGGDGTVHHALNACVVASVPVYHLPLGTENLFSRHFGMTREPEMLLASISHIEQCVQRVDVATSCFGTQSRMFSIMASIGPDASVVARLACARRGGISHMSYVAPMLAELTNVYLPRISVSVDGRPVTHGERGMLIVANSPEYALGVNPAREASMQDGMLDVVFMPASSAISAALWLARCATKMQLDLDSRCEGSRTASGRSVRVEFDRSERKKVMQLDGECVLIASGSAGSEVGSVQFEVMTGGLRVLRPVEAF